MSLGRLLLPVVALGFALGLAWGRQRERAPRADDPRPAAQIVGELDAVRLPTSSLEYGRDAEAVRRFHEDFERGARRIVDLAAELYEGHPRHPETPRAMDRRWAMLNNALGRCDWVLEETAALAELELTDALRDQLVQARARAALLCEDVPVEEKLALARAAVERTPADVRGTLALVDLAGEHVAEPQRALALAREALERFPDDKHVSVPARGLIRRLERVGQPFELELEDFLTGARVSAAELRGRPLVVQVWDTSMPGAVEELAALRALAVRRDVATITVHNVRCADGPEALRALLDEARVDWPVWYDDRSPWDTWAATQWGITHVPSYLLVDAEGRLAGASHRLATLERLLLPECGADGRALR